MTIINLSDWPSRYSVQVPGTDETDWATPATVNADSYQDLQEDDARLRHLLNNVKTALSGGPIARRFADVLEELRDQLVIHFYLEETDGYFVDMMNAAPEQSGLIASLLAEHRVLYTEVSRIVDDVGRRADSSAVTHPCERLRSRVRAFCDQLQKHERRERELIQRAYQDDVGVGD